MKIDQETLETAPQRYLALANHFRAHAPTSARFDFFRGPSVYPTHSELLELQNAVVVSGEWFVLAGGMVYCDAFVQSPFPPLSAYLARLILGEIMIITEPPVQLPIQRGFLLGRCANYCHWLTVRKQTHAPRQGHLIDRISNQQASSEVVGNFTHALDYKMAGIIVRNGVNLLKPAGKEFVTRAARALPKPVVVYYQNAPRL